LVYGRRGDADEGEGISLAIVIFADNLKQFKREPLKNMEIKKFTY